MTNIAFAGLTAAGKTTHAQRLASDLGYSYVSATDILFEILQVPDPGAHPWFTQLDMINAAREGDAVDDELESRLAALARTRDRTVFDSWALAWISPSPMPTDLAALDRYLTPLRDLQRSGLRISIHLGELFGAGFSRQVLSRIIPTRIGHGVLLLDDAETVQLIRDHRICLDMCPVSNTRLGVWDWTRSSPAAEAMRLGLPVTINSDNPVLFGAGLAANLALAGLSPEQLDTARITGNRYGYQR
jgi:hypothetical protein